MKGLWQNKDLRLASLGLFVLSLLALLAPFLSRANPDQIDLSRRLLAPGASAWFGTDELGRDLWARMLYGARVSLGIGALAAFLTSVLGVLLGLLAGYFASWLDALICRTIDVLLCVPQFFLILALIVVIGPGIRSLVIVMVLTGWTGVARIVRGEVLSLKGREFAVSARAAGASHLRIMFRHLLPNAMNPVYVAATFGIAGFILSESTLSFLGLGVQAPAASWGNILEQGRQYLGEGWWLILFPGLAIFATTLLVNQVGLELRRHFDVRSLREPL